MAEQIQGVDIPKELAKRYTDAIQSYEKEVESVKAIREGATGLFERFNDEHTKFANTAWGAYNAIVETEDYRKGWNISESALFGPRAQRKAKAFNLALTM